MAYALLAHRNAQRQMDALPRRIADGIREVLGMLGRDPHDPRFRLKPLRGRPGGVPTLRLRIADYRVLLRIDDVRKEILVVRIGHRSAVYRGLDRLDP